MKSWKNFSNGEPGGKAGTPGSPLSPFLLSPFLLLPFLLLPLRPLSGAAGALGRSPSSSSSLLSLTVPVEEMLTTDGSSRAARSAKLSGAPRARAGTGAATGKASPPPSIRTDDSRPEASTRRSHAARMLLERSGRPHALPPEEVVKRMAWSVSCVRQRSLPDLLTRPVLRQEPHPAAGAWRRERRRVRCGRSPSPPQPCPAAHSPDRPCGSRPATGCRG